jgi:intron-binding protein aquarius
MRRLTVALSRARLGLYILGRREVFEACYELKPAFELLFQRPDQLNLVTGELWPTTRLQHTEDDTAVPGETIMTGVEHLGQYVFEMTNAKIQQLKAAQGLPEQEGTQLLESVKEIDETELVTGPNEDGEDAEDEGTKVEGFEVEEE